MAADEFGSMGLEFLMINLYQGWMNRLSGGGLTDQSPLNSCLCHPSGCGKVMSGLSFLIRCTSSGLCQHWAGLDVFHG